MSVSAHRVRIGRAYDSRVRGDGIRVLVDRLWPRGLSKERADFDEWQKDVAPSPVLRQWYGHDPDLFDEFSARYRAELEDPVRARILVHLFAVARHGNLTMITASKAAEISEAAVLVSILNGESRSATAANDRSHTPDLAAATNEQKVC
ncbi:DUF488 domain-containing protein [Subtercola sp. RTI3]|uniref:DUF488 domain-containing protein n=1 Tax=Subtercola sp. RTI3 TaxID=3048639 RepID=UPI002B224A8B|nr:DUF488 family protein [Subtercola sp. RTI3]MEA9985963.1 DUF488 family protein [Subtercola sp. RTI3]